MSVDSDNTVVETIRGEFVEDTVDFRTSNPQDHKTIDLFLSEAVGFREWSVTVVDCVVFLWFHDSEPKPEG